MEFIDPPHGLREATIKRWFKHEGDMVTKGEPLVELETPEGSITLKAHVLGELANLAPVGARVTQPGETQIIGVIDDIGDWAKAWRGMKRAERIQIILEALPLLFCVAVAIGFAWWALWFIRSH